MDLSKLQTLRNMLVQGKSIQPVFEYFLDHFGEDEAFLALGEPAAPDPKMKSLLELVGQQLLKTDKVKLDMKLVAVREHHMIHGFIAINGKPASILYFDDMAVGIVGVINPSSGATRWSRFGAHMLPRQDAPSMN